MIVKSYMTANPITVDEGTSINEALFLMKKKRIRSLPVMKHEKLVGIVTDRDLQKVTPSTATTLDIWELNYLLAKLTVRDAMTPNPVTISPNESIAKAALLMHERTFESLPVMDEGKLIGIITESDVFAALVTLTGVKDGGIEIEVEMPDTPSSCKAVGDTIRERGLMMRGSLCHFDGAREGYRRVAFRVVGQELKPFVEWIRSKYTVVSVSED